MFGYLIPRNYMEAMQFDSENKNSKWYDVIKMEMESMREYKVTRFYRCLGYVLVVLNLSIPKIIIS